MWKEGRKKGESDHDGHTHTRARAHRHTHMTQNKTITKKSQNSPSPAPPALTHPKVDKSWVQVRVGHVSFIGQTNHLRHEFHFLHLHLSEHHPPPLLYLSHALTGHLLLEGFFTLLCLGEHGCVEFTGVSRVSKVNKSVSAITSFQPSRFIRVAYPRKTFSRVYRLSRLSRTLGGALCSRHHLGAGAMRGLRRL